VAKPIDEGGFDIKESADEFRFKRARDGDHLVTPFQCDLCHFRNILKRDPIQNLPQDIRIQKLIRRANLDALWAREPITVKTTLAVGRQGASIAASLGFKDKLFQPMGPFPLDDSFGMAAAIVMLQSSLRPGQNDKFVQFGTVQKFRSSFSNIYHASVQGLQATVMAKDTRKMTVTKCPTYGEFFERFVRGLHKRMGEIVKPDRALPLDVLKLIFTVMEKDWNLAATRDERYALAMEGSFYAIAYCCALRGEEVPLSDLYGIASHWKVAQGHPTKHVVVALLGRFKGETGENYHLMPIVDVTTHCLEPGKWIGRLLEIYEFKGIRHGPLFRTSSGQRIKAGDLEPNFFDRLDYVKDLAPHLLSSVEDVREEFGVHRSFRRGATSEAVNAGVPPDVIDSNNRWRQVHQAGASKPSMTMRQHYTDVRLILNHLLKFSQAL
jgi:hypothetical protein